MIMIRQERAAELSRRQIIIGVLLRSSSRSTQVKVAKARAGKVKEKAKEKAKGKAIRRAAARSQGLMEHGVLKAEEKEVKEKGEITPEKEARPAAEEEAVVVEVAGGAHGEGQTA